MNEVAKYLGRGLLVLALSGSVFACGDDDDGPNDNDAGPEAGSSGSRAGTGGRAGSGSGGRSGSDADAGPDPEECIEATEDVDAPVSAACAECLCDEDAEATIECNVDCWALIECVLVACDGDADDVLCIAAECDDEVSGDISDLMEVGMLSSAVPFDGCEAECPAPNTDPDAGGDTDAGN